MRTRIPCPLLPQRKAEPHVRTLPRRDPPDVVPLSAQGLVAGLNAAAWVQRKPSILFDRADSYIGVMVDDLVLQGVTEPYRMLTARAEYRLRLRADNAGSRLTPHAISIGCVSSERRAHFQSLQSQRSALEARLQRSLCGAALRKAGAAVSDDGIRSLAE